MNVLTCSNGLTRVVSHGLMLDTDQRPDLPFAFDALYYEPPTGLAFKVLAGEQIPLSAAEIAACEAFCDSFLDVADYHVFALDESGVFAGSMLKSEAISKNLAYRIVEAPDHPASKWNGSAWERIAAAILDNGAVRLMPDAVCDRCAVALSATEWAAWPTLPDIEHDEDWRWDFAAEAWRDASDPYVHAFDEVGAYVGAHRRSALRDGWGFTREAPETQASVMTPDGWKPVAASINEDGSVDIRPGGIRDEVMLLFTREEWARWPSRPSASQGEVWAWDFRAEAWRDATEFPVAAFELDGDQAGIFVGRMWRPEAEATGLGWTRTHPDHPASKWNGEAWQRIATVIMDDGSVRLMPEGVCQRCMLAFTAKEWAAFPQPAWNIPTQLGGWTWNFALEQWEDRRNIEDLRRKATYAARYLLETRGYMPPEMALALHEVHRLDFGETPFLDALSAASGVEPRVLAEEFLQEHTRFVQEFAPYAARLRSARIAIREAVQNQQLDAVISEILTSCGENGSCLLA